jgi:hypothetical protein
MSDIYNLSVDELKEIENIHNTVVGLEHFSERIKSDIPSGFPCEIEFDISKRILKKWEDKKDQWFTNISKSHNICLEEFCRWKVDFKKMAIQIDGNRNRSLHGRYHNKCVKRKATIFVNSVDIEIIRRLFEKLGTINDYIRMKLATHTEKDDYGGEVVTLATMLGVVRNEISDWYFLTAKEYNLDVRENEVVDYSFDSNLKQITVTHITCAE